MRSLLKLANVKETSESALGKFMMTDKEQLIQEIEQASDSLVKEVLHFLLFVKNKQEQVTTSQNQTILERMGGLPKHLLSVGNLSDRDVRRTILASRIRKRYQHES
jgi:hypothetical protein